jgi:hypothetical protein
MKTSMIYIDVKITDTANITVVCCLWQLKEKLIFSWTATTIEAFCIIFSYFKFMDFLICGPQNPYLTKIIFPTPNTFPDPSPSVSSLFLGSIHFLVLSGASKWWTAL